MKSAFILAVLLAVCALSSANDNNKRCTDNTRSCSDASECCSGCCYLGACDSPDRCTVMNQGACALHNCPADKECYLEKVQCITAPCPPIPACRPKNSADYDNYE